MKRYNPALNIMTEESTGGWVKWEDSNNELFRFSEICEKRIRELKAKIGQECNCREEIDSYNKQRSDMMNRLRELISDNYWWICPAHGYKKR